MKDNKIPKIHTIKKTPKETLEKWYKLMTIGRAIDEKAPNYLKQAIGWSYHAPLTGSMITCSLTTGICLRHFPAE